MKTIDLLAKRVKDDVYDKIDNFNFLEASKSQKEEFKKWAEENITPLLLALTKKTPDIVFTDEGMAIVLNLPKEEIFKSLEIVEPETVEVVDSLVKRGVLRFKNAETPAKRFIADSLNQLFSVKGVMAKARVLDDEVVVQTSEESLTESVPQVEGLASIQNLDTDEFINTVIVPSIEEKLRLLGFDSNYSVSYSNGVIQIEINETINNDQEIMDSLDNMKNMDIAFSGKSGIYALQNGDVKTQMTLVGDDANYVQVEFLDKRNDVRYMATFEVVGEDIVYAGDEGDINVLSYVDDIDIKSLKNIDSLKDYMRKWFNSIKSSNR